MVDNTTETEPPAICIGKPECVPQLGHSSMKKPEAWTQAKSDLVAHFLQVAGNILGGSWRNYHPSTLHRGGKKVHVDLPNIESVVFALIWFRQLIEEELLASVCKEYCRQVEDEGKRFWMKEWGRYFFDRTLKQAPPFGGAKGDDLTNLDLINAFLYGAQILHSKRKVKYQENIELYERLDQLEDRELAIWGLHSCFEVLTVYVIGIEALLRYDFDHWLETESIPAPKTCLQKTMFTWKPKK